MAARQALGDRVPIPPGMKPGHVLWVDTQAPGGPVERRFLCATQTDIDRGWVASDRLRQLRPGEIGLSSDADDVRSLTGNMEPAKVLDPVAFPPAHTGLVGRYWRCNLAELRKLYPRDGDTSVACWIVEAPWAHPVWHSYVAVLIHLRRAPGVPDPLVYLQGATHEIWLYALAHDRPREAGIRGRESPLKFAMEPKQFAAQFIEPTDAAAVSRVEAALAEVCSGHLSPDSGHHHQLEWAVRFGANMIKGHREAAE